MDYTSFKYNSIFNKIKPFRGYLDEVPHDWLNRFRNVTDLHNVEDKKRLVCARLLMKGNAAIWYLAHKQQIKTYADFEDQFLRRFADDSWYIANALLGRYQYNNETVRVYANRILHLHDRLQMIEAPLPECVLTIHFLNGLLPKLKEKVMSRRPKNLQDAIDDAVFLEQCMNSDARARQPFSQIPCQPPQPVPQPQATPAGRTLTPGPAPATAPKVTGRSTILRVPDTSMDPVNQLLSLPMKFSVEGYIKHCSEANFNKTLSGLRRVRKDRSAPSIIYTMASAPNGDSRFHLTLLAYL